MKQRFKKVVVAGILAWSTIFYAGVASAASYTVQNNDTLYLIAQKYGVSLGSLIQTNPQIANPDVIWQGMGIRIPTNRITSQNAAEVINIVNQERAKAGLKSLQKDSALSNMALDKAKDMYNSNYFSHISPNYGSPFDMMQDYGIRYSYAGENIAKGQTSPEEVMQDWMNSTGHRKNILNPHYTKIGVAYYNGEWVQEFTG